MPGETNYTVQRKEEIRKLNQAGEIETWYRIYAISKGGTYYHVEVPERNLDVAPKALTERANKLDAI